MTVLLSALQTALNDVVVACLEAADGHEAAAGILADDQLARVLCELAGARRDAAAEVGLIVRERGDLPPTADVELETVRELASRVKAALAPDQRETLIEERAAAESHLATCVEQALACADLPAAARPPLLQLAADSERARAQLSVAAAG